MKYKLTIDNATQAAIESQLSSIPSDTTTLELNFYKHCYCLEEHIPAMNYLFAHIPPAVNEIDLSPNENLLSFSVDTESGLGVFGSLFTRYYAELYTRRVRLIASLFSQLRTTMTTINLSGIPFDILDTPHLNILKHNLRSVQKVMLYTLTVNKMSKASLDAFADIFPNVEQFVFLSGGSVAHTPIFSEKTAYLQKKSIQSIKQMLLSVDLMLRSKKYPVDIMGYSMQYMMFSHGIDIKATSLKNRIVPKTNHSIFAPITAQSKDFNAKSFKFMSILLLLMLTYLIYDKAESYLYERNRARPIDQPLASLFIFTALYKVWLFLDSFQGQFSKIERAQEFFAFLSSKKKVDRSTQDIENLLASERYGKTE
ncbi:MAG: hypothetical protein ACOYKA_00830 [Legionellaceae bacterium]